MTGSDFYMREVCNGPVLTDDEERELTQRYAKTKDPSARAKLVAANLKLVVQVARQFTRTKSVMDDLIQEGNIGLIDALEKFDWQRGCKLSTYAKHFIHGKMVKFLLDNWNNAALDDETSDEYVLQEKQERADQFPDVLLEQAQHDAVKSQVKELIDYFEQTLSQRYLEIFRSLWRSEQTTPLQEIGRRHNLTAPRIHQIEREILGKLRSFIDDRMGSALAVC